MKKLTAILLIFILLLSLPLGAAGEEDDPDAGIINPTISVQPPKKLLYEVGEAPDYTGGALIYRIEFDTEYPLEPFCSGLDTSTPGNKTVTVDFNGLTAYFNVLVLSAEEPIITIKDIARTHWSYSYFGPCMKAGFFLGNDQNRLEPNRAITRAEMAQIIYRAWQNDPAVMGTVSENAAAPFSDVRKGDWYYEAIEACRKAGIIRGMDGGRCNPNAPITREDAVLMLMRIRYTDAELAAVHVNETIAASGIQPTDFRQVSGYARAAMALALGDLIYGNEKNAITPRSSITRAESAAIFQRLFLKDYQWTAPELPPEEEPEGDPAMPLVYLSPSNQIHNPYAAGNTTEGKQMNLLAETVKKVLLNAGYRVFIADVNTSIYLRPEEAKNLGAKLYIPIHSNAGGDVTGTYVFYNGAIPGCKEFSREIFDRVAALTGTPYSTSRHKEDFETLINQDPYHEVGAPTMPLAYIEVEFHDKANKATWIIQNNDRLARAIADGVIAYSEKYLIK